MVAVAGLWELGWNTPIKEIELWEHPLRDFDVDVFFMGPVSGIRSGAVREVEDIAEVIREHRERGIPVVFVDERGAAPLCDFGHPEHALYVFGKASLSALTAYGQAGDLSVRIETATGLGLLWPHQAACVVLHDRRMKWRS